MASHTHKCSPGPGCHELSDLARIICTRRCQRTLTIKASPQPWGLSDEQWQTNFGLNGLVLKRLWISPFKKAFKNPINFAALFFFGICLILQSLFSGELTGKELLCVICCTLAAMLLMYGGRTSPISHPCLIWMQAFWSSGEWHIPQFYCWQDHPGSNDLGIVFSVTNGRHLFSPFPPTLVFKHTGVSALISFVAILVFPF